MVYKLTLIIILYIYKQKLCTVLGYKANSNARMIMLCAIVNMSTSHVWVNTNSPLYIDTVGKGTCTTKYL